MGQPTWKKHTSLVICVPPPIKHISLVICLPPPGKNISLVKCVPTPAKHVSLVICVPVSGKHISLVICVPLPAKHISLVACVPPPGGKLIFLVIGVSQVGKHISLVFCGPLTEKHVSLLICVPHMYSKGVNSWFLAKTGHFSPSFFFLGNIGQENFFCDVLERKNAFLGYKNKKLKKSKNCHFSKGVNPWFWPNNGHFSNFFLLGKIDQENVYYDIVERKNAFLGYKRRSLKS